MAVNFTNTSLDEIYLDTDNIDQHTKRIKKYLSNINDDLVALKGIYSTLANHKQTKGKFKKSSQKIVNNCTKYIKKNAQVRANLEKVLDKSAREYLLALQAFNQLDNIADELGNE